MTPITQPLGVSINLAGYMLAEAATYLQICHRSLNKIGCCIIKMHIVVTGMRHH